MTRRGDGPARVLIIVPPSESKRPPARGRPARGARELSFPALLRRAADPRGADGDERGSWMRWSGCLSGRRCARGHPEHPALRVPGGAGARPVHGAAARRPRRVACPAAAGRAEEVPASSCRRSGVRFGCPSASRRIAPCLRAVIGVDRLEATWREVLPAVLADAAGHSGVVVDIRSPWFQATGMPAGLGDRTVVLRVDKGSPGHRFGDVIAKRARGEAVHYLLESGAEPADPLPSPRSSASAGRCALRHLGDPAGPGR